MRLYTDVLSIKKLLPPSSSGMTESPSMGMNVKTMPATTPGSDSGRITWRRVCVIT